jgi:hypothetical protein
MRVVITGLTESTITFNEIQVSSGAKLNLHGEEHATVEIDTVYQTNEVNILKKAGLISIEDLEVKPVPTPEPIPAPTPAPTPVSDESQGVKSITPEKATPAVQETVEEDVKPEKKGPQPIKRGRGRPKGAKNKTKADDKEDPTESSRVIVAGEDGAPVESKMTKESDIDKTPEPTTETLDSNPEPTRASIEAMEKLEEEEKDDKSMMEGLSDADEKELPINEQMGRDATIFTGKSSAQKEMKNSVIPESEVARAADPFIDRGDVDEKDRVDANTNAFLDDLSEGEKSNTGSDDDTDDTFVEL